MKLSELIFEAKIVKEELDIRSYTDGRGRSKWMVFDTDDPDKRVGNTFDSEGAAEEFRDAERARRANPNAETPRSPRSGRNNSRARSRAAPAAPATPDPTIRAGSLTPGVSQGTNGRYYVYLPDGKTIVTFTGPNARDTDAEKLFEYAKELDSQGKTPEEIARAVRNPPDDIVPTQRASQIRVTANAIKRNIAAMSIAEFEASQLGPRMSRWMSGTGGKIIKFLGRTFQVVEIPLGVFLGMMFAIDEIDKEMAEPGVDAETVEALQREADIIAGNAYVMFISMVLPIIRSVKNLRRLIAGIKVIVRGAAVVVGATVGTAATPVGTLIGGATGFVLTELTFAAITLILSMPSTHRYLAEAIAATALGDVMAWVGQQGNEAMRKVAEALGNKYGTGFLVRSFSTEMQTSGGIEGDYYSDSEWAKLVFGSLMFGEGEESKLVPYIPESRREDLLNQALGQSQQPGQTNQENNPFPAADLDAPAQDLLPPTPEPSVNSGGPGFRQGQ